MLVALSRFAAPFDTNRRLEPDSVLISGCPGYSTLIVPSSSKCSVSRSNPLSQTGNTSGSTLRPPPPTLVKARTFFSRAVLTGEPVNVEASASVSILVIKERMANFYFSRNECRTRVSKGTQKFAIFLKVISQLRVAEPAGILRKGRASDRLARSGAADYCGYFSNRYWTNMAGKARQSFGFRQYRLFSLFGFQVKLDLSWLLLALLISWSLAAGVFPVTYPGLSRHVYAWMGITGALGVFFSIVFHEFSHSLVARRFGMPIKGITLFIFGGVAEMEKEPPSPRSEFLMAVAGPLASFLLAFIFWRIQELATAAGWPTAVVGVSHSLANINMIVAVFNLVPAFPLDGGRMLRAILWHLKSDLRAATRICSRIGRGFGLALMILGVVAFVQGNFIGGMWWFLIGIFLRGAASAAYQQLLLQEVLHDQPVARFMRRDPVTVPPSITIDRWIEDFVYRHHFKMFPVVENSELLGCISIENVKRVPRDAWHHKTVRELMEPCSKTNTVTADTETMALLSAMLRGGKQTRYMVVDNGRLVGMISLKDLLDLIALKLEVEPPAS